MKGNTLRRLRRDDEGFTMLAVLASAFLVLGLVLVGIGFAVVGVQRSKVSQDTRGALAAAQAGVQDYLNRLNECETYYLTTNTCGGTDVALGVTAKGQGAVVPGTAGVNRAIYRYRVVSTPLTAGGNGAVRLQATGEVNGRTRTLTVDLVRSGFLKYLYYTDFETFSPANTARLFQSTPSWSPGTTDRAFTFTGSGSSNTVTFPRNGTYTLKAPTVDQVTRGCQRYYYSTPTSPARTTFPRTVNVGGVDREIWPSPTDTSPFSVSGNFTCLTISFSGNDSFDGPVHSNDALRLSGPVTFKQATTTAWDTASTKKYYGDSDPSASSQRPKYLGRFDMPETATEQLAMATAGGCVYEGPTSIKFLSDGKLEVVSPNTTAGSVRAGCSTGNPAAKMTSAQTVNGPGNGVVYVKSTTTPGNCIAAFQQVSGDVTDYDNNNCRAGDAFVQGDVKGARTITAEHDVVVTGDVKYVGGLSGEDVLGLIGQNNVAVWHPVSGSGTTGTNLRGTGDRRIDAAIASVSNSFTVFNYSTAPKVGTLQVNGVIIQKFRGPVATGSGSVTSTGYGKDYRYDNRLQYLPPPSFIAPVNDPWTVGTLSEQAGS
ncbi:hypothetical protein [Kineococcus terrestris]|uniref:hypothetical protein n=1 Tax=Kineococcus terrestris TaxID=2044856 RepID=UPI0034DB5BB1